MTLSFAIRSLLPLSILTLFAACGDGDDTHAKAKAPAPSEKAGLGSEQDSCEARLQRFEREVWGPLLSTTCIGCHTSDGLAISKGAKFVLETPQTPRFLQKNLNAVRAFAFRDASGLPRIVAKATGTVDHGGGRVIASDSANARALEELSDRLIGAPTCEEAQPQSLLGNLTLLEPGASFRRALVRFGGRVPRAYEVVHDETALSLRLDALLEEPAFLDWFEDFWNDILLVRKDRDDVALNKIAPMDYPNATYWGTTQSFPGNPAAEKAYLDARRRIGHALSREPLALIRHVVKNNKPFSEILTANYTVANAYLAQLYGEGAQFPAPSPANEGEYRAITLTQRKGAADAAKVPHAGILSTHAFLDRWPTSATNHSRGRARFLFKTFLGKDIFALAGRPVDAAAALTNGTNATQENPSCAVCHHVLDPVASAFRGWDESYYVHYAPDTAVWPPEMPEVGLVRSTIGVNDKGRELPWIAQQIASDPRFPRGVVDVVYAGILDRPLLAYPTDASASDYEEALRTWHEEQAFLQSLSDAFVRENLNIKGVVKRVLLSPFFRATNVPRELVSAAFVGRELLTPEQLDRKVTDLFGFGWSQRDYVEERSRLTSPEHHLLAFGGMDSNSVLARVCTPNATILAVQGRLATEMSCRGASFDFTLSPGDRKLFPFVAQTDTPSKNEAAVRQNLVYLFGRFLGEQHEPTDPEIDSAFELFRESYDDFVASNFAGFGHGDCAGTHDWTRFDDTTLLPKALPAERRIEQDVNYTIRSWTAVLTYLMLDPRFLTE